MDYIHDEPDNNEHTYDSTPPPLLYDCIEYIKEDEFINAVFYGDLETDNEDLETDNEDLQTDNKTFTQQDMSEEEDVDILPTKQQLHAELKMTQVKYKYKRGEYEIDETILNLSASQLNQYIKKHNISKNEAIDIKKIRRRRLNAIYARISRESRIKEHKK